MQSNQETSSPLILSTSKGSEMHVAKVEKSFVGTTRVLHTSTKMQAKSRLGNMQH